MSDGWDLRQADWKLSKPIGKGAENFLMENADYVIYLRQRDNQPCPQHWNSASQTQNGLRLDGEPCPICWGTGKAVTPIITPIRIVLGSAEGKNDFRMAPGYVEDWNIAGYVPRGMKPEYEDLILLVEWNIPVDQVPRNPARRAVSLNDVYIIKGSQTRFEKEFSFAALDMKPFNIERKLLEVNLPLTVGVPVFQAEDWKRTDYWK
jgi:hypothetical protein